ncbi:unnamed protein product [Rotaria sp. Silwood1]|nr:unnamed protein product [Rotaria sp. Silwood1]CAF3679614.1 unnamed protein product [Rotaria sp. Silwood1]CAF4934996.1 unnamed protein product [Rotaria sp. Silwood1]
MIKSIIKLSIAQPFNIIFIQIPSQYDYLAVLREIFILLEKIYTEILPKQRCFSIEELLNKTFVNYEYFNHHMCICDLDRFSNCFIFNHTINYGCHGYNDCENKAQCFQNNQTCPMYI